MTGSNANLMFLPKSGICLFVPIDGHFGQMFWDMNFKFVLPFIYINFDIQTKFEVNQTQISQIATSQNPILPKCHTPKNLLLLHFSMNLSETFRIMVNMDFAHTSQGRFLI